MVEDTGEFFGSVRKNWFPSFDPKAPKATQGTKLSKSNIVLGMLRCLYLDYSFGASSANGSVLETHD
jgi:hypothetical protein